MDLNPFGGNFNVNVDERDTKNAVNIATLGFIPGMVASSVGFDIMDPFGNKAMMKQQQEQVNAYRNQQEALIRDEQNRRWQNELSNSWAAYGAQRRSQVMMTGTSAATALGTTSANDLYLGGR